MRNGKLGKREREIMEGQIFNEILNSWSEGIPPNQPKIKKELSRMSDKKLVKTYEVYFDEYEAKD